jgi:uncharacterized protein
MGKYDDDLSVAELDELQAFLDQPELRGRAMDVAMLEGLAAAVIVGPELVMPSRWMAWVWDAEAGEEAPEFESLEHANRIMALVMRHYNGVARAFMEEPAGFTPLFSRDPRCDVRQWCAGFLCGMGFADAQWSELMSEQLAWFTPFTMLGSDEDFSAEEITGGYPQRWRDAIVPTLVQMHAHWRKQRDSRPAGLVGDRFAMGAQRATARREQPKVGRNDPCPCGSGRKFKKCCGGGGSTVH